MKKLPLSILLFLSFSGFAQPNLDSLLNLWKDTSQSDSTRAFAYQNYIRSGIVFTKPDSAFVLAQNLITYGEKNNYPIAKALGYNVQGISKVIQGNNASSLFYLKKSLAIYEGLNHEMGIMASLNNIGGIYLRMENAEKAKEYIRRIIEIAIENKDKISLVKSQLNMASALYLDEEYEESMEYLETAIKQSEGYNDNAFLADVLHLKADILSIQGNHSEALVNVNEAWELQKGTGNRYGLARTHTLKGNIELRQANYSLAIEDCRKGYDLAIELGSLTLQQESCKCLYDSYKALGKGPEALIQLEKLNLVNGEIQKEDAAKQLQEMEFAKQLLADSLASAEKERFVAEAHKEEVRKKNLTRNYLAGGGLLLLLLAGGLYSRNRYIKKSKDIIEEEKDRSNNLLLNILPADIAEELKIHGKAEARDFDTVSILFTDFKGFTETSEKLTAQELVSEINACFEIFDDIMGKHGIEKIKTIGDAYMAAGGLPVPTNDSVKNTVRAALEMQDFIVKRKADNDAQNKPAFEMRVGIHTGPVVAGIVGVKKFQYDIWGDTVNTASRIESNGEAGKVNISQATYEMIKEDPQFAFENRGKIEAKGKGAIEMWFVSMP